MIDSCAELLPPSPDRRWVIEIEPCADATPGGLIQFSVETRTRTYRSAEYGLDLDPDAVEPIELELMRGPGRATRDHPHWRQHDRDRGRPGDLADPSTVLPFDGWVNLRFLKYNGPDMCALGDEDRSG